MTSRTQFFLFDLTCCLADDKVRIFPDFGKNAEIFFEKKAEKIWWVSKMAIPLHRFSPQTGCESNSNKEFIDMFATILT